MSYKAIDFSQGGGLYVYQDTIEWLQVAYNHQLDAVAKLIGDKVIVTGLTFNAGIVSDGWVVLNGELLPVVGGPQLTHLFVETIVTNEQFDDGSEKPVYTIKRLKFTNTASGNYPYADFKRLPFNSLSIKEAFTKTQTLLKNILNEAAVIMSGCLVTNVTGTGTGTCDISGGVALMDGEYVTAPVYSGFYPVYLKPDATWVTVDPGGTRIKFDHETSQRYKDVMRRMQFDTGHLYLSKNPADAAFFDAASGLGKWKWLGWKLSFDMRGRVPLGYDNRSADPVDGVWDNNYRVVGNTGGEKKHTLTEAELPEHSHDAEDGDPSGKFIKRKEGGPGGGFGVNNSGGGYEYADISTGNAGSGEAHENRQPYRVILFIERL